MVTEHFLCYRQRCDVIILNTMRQILPLEVELTRPLPSSGLGNRYVTNGERGVSSKSSFHICGGHLMYRLEVRAGAHYLHDRLGAPKALDEAPNFDLGLYSYFLASIRRCSRARFSFSANSGSRNEDLTA